MLDNLEHQMEESVVVDPRRVIRMSFGDHHQGSVLVPCKSFHYHYDFQVHTPSDVDASQFWCRRYVDPPKLDYGPNGVFGCNSNPVDGFRIAFADPLAYSSQHSHVVFFLCEHPPDVEITCTCPATI